MTDEEILAMIGHPGQRDQGFRQLVVKYQQRLYLSVRRQVVSHDDADDVMQNTFMKIFRHIASFEGRSELYTWMYRIAGNEVINYHKQQSKNRHLELNGIDKGHREAHVSSGDIADVLQRAITGLPERQQMVFRMRYFDELSYKEMATLLNLTEGALKASFHHAVKKIEAEIKARQIF